MLTSFKKKKGGGNNLEGRTKSTKDKTKSCEEPFPGCKSETRKC